jgi:FkbM family methyltransferase
MWIPESLVDTLDQPHTRPELAREATSHAQAALPGVDIEIFWDDLWIRRVGPYYFPDPDMWRASDLIVEKWPAKAEKYLRDGDDYWFHVYKPKPRDRIVDIGAGRGEDVFAFSRAVGHEGHVWAIEPHPLSFAILEKFCAFNKLDNVTAVQVACVEEHSDLQIETLPVWESNFVRTGEPSPTSSSVKGVRFDDLASEMQIGPLDFLKMNIEGAERVALPGCERALKRTQFACIAAHDFRADRGEGEQFRTLEFVRGFLKRGGFEVITRDDDPRYYVPYHVHGYRRAE